MISVDTREDTFKVDSIIPATWWGATVECDGCNVDVWLERKSFLYFVFQPADVGYECDGQTGGSGLTDLHTGGDIRSPECLQGVARQV